MKDYNNLIHKRIDKSFNYILSVTSVIAFIAAIFLLVADLHIIYGVINLLASSIMFVMAYFAKKINTVTKIIAVVIITGTVGLASYVGGSFSSAFITLFILANVVAIMFLERKYALIVSTITCVIMLILAVSSFYTEPTVEIYAVPLTWALQLVAFILLMIVLIISSYSIKNFLFENIESLEKAIEQSNSLAYYDLLTSLPNEYKFKMDMDNHILEHNQDGFLLFLNLRSLSLINSTLGREVGDQALIEAGRILEDLDTKDRYLAKIGANEFAIWFDNITEKELHYHFKTIMSELNKQNIKKKLEFYASYCKFNAESDTFDDVYHRAELTLTYAKTNNLLNLQAYNDQLEKDMRRIEKIKDLIEQAIINEEFVLYYHAKYDSRTNKVVSVEALSRWNSKELGFVSPYEFIPIIESMNMSSEFGNFVIRKATDDYKRLIKKYNEDITVSINISPSQLTNYEIIKVLEEAIETNKIPPHKMIVEITEDVMIEGLDIVLPILKKIRDLNVRISLDDFGTGYSSLNYIANLELDELKIDKTFVDSITEDKRMTVLIENIMNISEHFELDVVAEGVETKEQLDILTQLGCYIIQGYYYVKPEPIE